MANAPSATLNVFLSTTNKNVSPIIDLNTSGANFTNYTVNNQRIVESIASANEFGYLTDIRVTGAGTDGGADYGATPPTVTIYGGGGSGATATCTVAAGVVDSITLVTPGSGYISAPKILFTTTDTTPTVNAIAVTTISDYNSELAAENGSALSRYITKQQELSSVSNGIRLFATAYSNPDSSFEVYIRSGMGSSSTPHSSLPWVLMSCDVDRNQSTALGQFKEYTFYKDSMTDFDVFSLKFVLRTMTPWDPPVIDNYRATVLAA